MSFHQLGARGGNWDNEITSALLVFEPEGIDVTDRWTAQQAHFVGSRTKLMEFSNSFYRSHSFLLKPASVDVIEDVPAGAGHHCNRLQRRR